MMADFTLLDAVLVAIPVGLALLGLIRGAPAELASWLGCVAGVAACWVASQAGPLRALGQPGAPLAALWAGLAVWWLVCLLSERLGWKTRWVDLGGTFDSAAGCAMGAGRGVVVAAALCLTYAVIAVKLGFGSPPLTGAFPVFQSAGSWAMDAALAPSWPVAPPVGSVPGDAVRLARPSVPLPVILGEGARGAGSAAGPQSVGAVVPGVIAAPALARPIPAGIADIPVRGVPVGLIEAHHNILHPNGIVHPVAPRREHR